MAKRSEAWKDLERSVALNAREAGFGKAFRVCRGDDIGVSATDVILPEIPFVKIDTKYRQNSFSHHELFFTGEKKYCQEDGDFMVLPTKGGRERGSLSTIRTEVLMKLLAFKYLPKDKPVDALSCPRCGGLCLPKTIGLSLSECSCNECGITFFMGTPDVPAGAAAAALAEATPIELPDTPLEMLVTEETAVPNKKSRAKKVKA